MSEINTPVLQRQGSVKVKRIKLITFRDELSKMNLKIGSLLLICPEKGACIKHFFTEVIEFCDEADLISYKAGGNNIEFSKLKEKTMERITKLRIQAKSLRALHHNGITINGFEAEYFLIESYLWDIKDMITEIDDFYLRLYRKRILFIDED